MHKIEYFTSPFAFLLNRTCKTDNKNVYHYLTHNITEINQKQLHILENCRNPHSMNELLYLFTESDIQKLISEKLLADINTIWKQHYVRYLYIETSTDCNWKCEYCCAHYQPKKRRFMDMELFNEIIRKAIKYKKVELIGLNFYNEPTLDIFFDERLKMIAETKLKLNLYTNASGLNTQRLEYLKITGILNKIYFNLPSLDKDEFVEMTGSKEFEHTIKMVDYSFELGLDTMLSVQGQGEKWKKNISKIRSKYGKFMKENMHTFSTWPTDDRAGILQNKYKKDISITNDYLFGCRDLLNAIYIDIDGNCLICYNDFFRKNNMGNITNKSLDAILEDKAATRFRQIVFGYIKANNDFICRKCSLMQDQIDMIKFIERMNEYKRY